jgi:hypothetical protein
MKCPEVRFMKCPEVRFPNWWFGIDEPLLWSHEVEIFLLRCIKILICAEKFATYIICEREN